MLIPDIASNRKIDLTQLPLAAAYSLHLGDNALILSQRLAEWCGHGPVLEQDIALTNIALDLLGQARLYLSYAAEHAPSPISEDELAFFRDATEFRNVLLVEQPNEDWGVTIARQFFYDVYNYLHCEQLRNSKEPRLAEIAEKAWKEITYHLRFSSEWMVRLGDGTELSHQKMQEAMDHLWKYIGELCTPTALDIAAAEAGLGVDLLQLKPRFEQKINEVLIEATLRLPDNTWMQLGGKEGKHTEYLGFILAEMQHVQRSYPGQQW